MRPWRNEQLESLVPAESSLDAILASERLMPSTLRLNLTEIPREKWTGREAEVVQASWSLDAPVLSEREFGERVLVMLGTPVVMIGDYERIEAVGPLGQLWLAEQYAWWCRDIDDSQPGQTHIRWSFALMLTPASMLDAVLSDMP